MDDWNVYCVWIATNTSGGMEKLVKIFLSRASAVEYVKKITDLTISSLQKRQKSPRLEVLNQGEAYVSYIKELDGKPYTKYRVQPWKLEDSPLCALAAQAADE